MKRKFVIFIGGAAIVAITAFNVSLNTRGNSLSDIALSNIEALAQSEINNKQGRYRTIFCDCQRLDCSKNHCCYNTAWSNCPSNVTGCSGTVYGCND